MKDFSAKRKNNFPLKNLKKGKSTFIFLTILVSAVLINRIELLNYKISEIFSYLVEQLSNISVLERESNRNSIIYCIYFFYNEKGTFTFYLIFKLPSLFLLQAFLIL
jgi:hypothetical protein